MVLQREILLIVGKQDFTTGAMIHTLELKGYKVTVVDATIDALSKLEDTPAIWLLQAGEFLTRQVNFVVFVKDLVFEQKKYLYVFGEPNIVKIVRDVIPIYDKAFVFREYAKPFNSKDLIDDIENDTISISKTKAKKKILIVDDNPTTLKTLKRSLDLDFTVYVITNEYDVFSFLEKTTPDLILLDYEMPIINGIQLMEILHKDTRYSHIPVIFLTGRTDTEIIVRSVELKAKNYIPKSLPQNQILEKIKQFFSK